MGGARVKLIHPIIATGKHELPSISIRLYQTAPVRPEDIIRWKVAPEIVIKKLMEILGKKARMLVVGGTNTAKPHSFLRCAMAEFIRELVLSRLKTRKRFGWITIMSLRWKQGLRLRIFCCALYHQRWCG